MSEVVDLVEEVPRYLASAHAPKLDLLYPGISLARMLPNHSEELLPFSTTMQAVPNMVGRAVMLATDASVELADSYRDYRVGAAVVGCNYGTGMYGMFAGFNIKNAPGDSALNIHAEQLALAKARFNGLNEILGIVVVADPSDSDANPDNNPTLRPCGRCIEMFKMTPEISEQTLILGATPDLNTAEFYTVGALNKSLEAEALERLFDGEFSLTKDMLDEFDDNVRPTIIEKFRDDVAI